MSIQRLPADVAVQIESSVAVTSLNAAVGGLLRNALDASATRITVSVDYSRGRCVVEDNGEGIPAAESLPEGGLGKLHHTSKYPPRPELHGRLGVLLFSVASLSFVSILSRCRGASEASGLTMHNGSVLRRFPSDTPPAHGTRVSVHDLFGCMPVRARLRPTPAPAAWSRDWDALVHAVTALLLAWPNAVVVSLRSENGTDNGRLPATTLRVARRSADVTRVSELLTRAALCEPSGAAAWVRVGSSVPGITISGCVSVTPSASKRAQFIRIGVTPLRDRGYGDALYDEINRLFADSWFGTGASPSRPSQQTSRKAVDRWPMFSIGIDLDGQNAVEVDDILDDRRQLLTVIRALVRTMFVQFLKEHGFYRALSLADDKPKVDSTLESPSKRRRTGLFDLPLRISPPRRPVNTMKHSNTPDEEETSMQVPEATSKFFAPRPAEEAAPSDRLGRLGLLRSEANVPRASFAKAQVIGQVDQKFVLVRVLVQTDGVLLLVDQHAADERCRVEALFADYFVPSPDHPGVLEAQTIRLDVPMQFELDASERPLLERAQDVFRCWGVVYSIDPGRVEDPVRLRVHRLPAALVARCRHQGRLVMDILRTEIWADNGTGRSLAGHRLTAAQLAAGTPWTGRFHACPKSIVDQLNTMACHNAIRFNDPLTHEQCCDLIQRLQQCVLLFQCAHGRPSVVPLVTIGDMAENQAIDPCQHKRKRPEAQLLQHEKI